MADHDTSVFDTEAAKKLTGFIERIEGLEEEKATTAELIKNEFTVAKGEGFDPKVMKVILRLRKRDADEIQEEEALIETYRTALGMT